MKYLIRQLGTRLRRTPHIGEKFDRHFSNAWKGFVMAVGEAAAKAKAQADEQEAEAVPKKIEDAFHALTDLADKIIEAIPGRRSPPEPDLTELRRWLVDTLSAHDSANIQVAKVLAQLSSRTPGASRSAELMAKNVEIAESDLQRMVDEAQSQLKQLEQKWNQ